MKAFAVSDIHGVYSAFEEILSHWNRSDKLVVLGDMIDRGPHSYKVVKTVMDLSKKHDVTYLMSNHEKMLLDYLENPDENGEMYYLNGGNKTISSFMQSYEIFHHNYQKRAKKMAEKHSEEFGFLKAGKLFYQFGKVLFTHAGFCSWCSDWHETTDDQFLWIRGHFRYVNQTGLVNVFGHTPAQLINEDRSNQVWTSEDKAYIGIDGACAYGGQLNAVLLHDSGELLETYTVRPSFTH